MMPLWIRALVLVVSFGVLVLWTAARYSDQRREDGALYWICALGVAIQAVSVVGLAAAS